MNSLVRPCVKTRSKVDLGMQLSGRPPVQQAEDPSFNPQYQNKQQENTSKGRCFSEEVALLGSWIVHFIGKLLCGGWDYSSIKEDKKEEIPGMSCDFLGLLAFPVISCHFQNVSQHQIHDRNRKFWRWNYTEAKGIQGSSRGHLGVISGSSWSSVWGVSSSGVVPATLKTPCNCLLALCLYSPLHLPPRDFVFLTLRGWKGQRSILGNYLPLTLGCHPCILREGRVLAI